MLNTFTIQIDIITFLLYFLVASLSIPIVRVLGPVSLVDYQLEEQYDFNSGPVNVLYRIISPVLICGVMSLVASALIRLFANYELVCPWIPVLLYWIILAMVKALKHKLSDRVVPFTFEAILSIAIAALFELFVLSELRDGNLAILDSSNYAFQLELAVLFMCVQVIVSVMVRIQYRTYLIKNERIRGSNGFEFETRARSLIDTSEKKLYYYVRKFEKYLPLRYKQDPLLWDIFFTIMAIEDSNRPPAFRVLERMACTLKLAKTTGIMQQNGGKPLTDEESVQIAVAYVETMWDSFLRSFAKSDHINSEETALVFGPTWYRYRYNEVSDALETSFSAFYGDYCGSRLLDANFVFSQVKQFEERRHYNLLPDYVTSRGSLFNVESSWLSGYEAFWASSYSVRLISVFDDDQVKAVWYRDDAVSEDVSELSRALKAEGGLIYRVDFAERSYARVFCIVSDEVLPKEILEKWEKVLME